MARTRTAEAPRDDTPPVPDLPELVHWPLERFVEYTRNPRRNDHAVDRTAAAIGEFGFRVPILARSDGLVVDGHLRLKAAKQLGLETVPVLLVDDMTDSQIKAFRLSVNRVADFAEWDEALLSLEIGDLAALDVDLNLLGFDADLDRFIAGEAAAQADNDRPAEPWARPQINTPPADPSTLDYKPTLAPTLGTREYTDADMTREDARLQGRFEQPQKDPYRVVCPQCGKEFNIDV